MTMDKKFIPLSVPNLKGNELKYVTAAVEEEWVSTGGPYVTEFEEKIKNYVGTSGAASCQNGTAGLHLSMVLLGVTHDDMVIVPTLTFIAAVNPVKYAGAEPIFMDCDDSLCMDPEKLEEFCENECEVRGGHLYYKKNDKKIKALVVVHVFGNTANMERIMQIAEKYKLKVVEDATESLGTYFTSGKYMGKYTGTIGDIGVYSFNGNKIITTGGGGVIVSNDTNIVQRARHIATQAKADTLYFVHDEVGYNYRMTNLQAALGIAQLEQLETFIETKKRNYEYYKEYFSSVDGLKILDFNENARVNYWFYSLFIEDSFSMNRDEMIKYLDSNNIQSRPIWALINEQVMYKDSPAYKIEKAKYYVNHIVNIPCSTNLSTEDAKIVADTIKGAVKKS